MFQGQENAFVKEFFSAAEVKKEIAHLFININELVVFKNKILGVFKNAISGINYSVETRSSVQGNMKCFQTLFFSKTEKRCFCAVYKCRAMCLNQYVKLSCGRFGEKHLVLRE